MSKITIVWKASRELLQEEFVSTGERPKESRKFEIDLTDLTPGERRRIIEIDEKRYSQQVVDLGSLDKFTPDSYNFTERHSLSFGAEPTVAQVVAHAILVASEARAIGEHGDRWSLRALVDDARRGIRKERREADKVAWIAEHGSSHLAEAFNAGYNCQRGYVIERAALEAPSFVVDFNDTADWSDRSYPTPEALVIERAARALGLGVVKTVWLTAPPSDEVESDDDYDGYCESFEKCEAVVVQGYLDKYTMVRVMQAPGRKRLSPSGRDSDKGVAEKHFLVYSIRCGTWVLCRFSLAGVGFTLLYPPRPILTKRIGI